MSTRFSAEEAQARLPELLDRAESGEEIVITRFGAPSAVLRRADSADGAASSGVLRSGSYGVLGAAWAAPVGGEAAGEVFDVGTDYGQPDWGQLDYGDAGCSG
ncbi:type II toxin-antitoxin system prevent-host-death family antitoxin [Saccharopolyspora sp. HNM0986]|uniref:type II toxin-antitoxin system Phd/YefM family antitoxin n=1 Tax=Saccharopolyspora galaxeae TaxID=2781241 RepID=UPI00190A75FB|nr:type II toxin-antitoxin system prevent-host-death family antitoxin [Saccharopolyspora sp. HNM0986]MBK0867447.1 type II toxin-antitoxin system prevent-host-death family antitoxin [Saccharopolyspora sp. HNM0986]